MSQRAISINGRFLLQKVSGVQRYARELVTALDRILVSDDTFLSGYDWSLIAPQGAQCDLPLQRIKFRAAGAGGGHIWEQMHLRRAPGLVVNLGNSGPVFRRKSMVVIHDMAVFRTPQNFGRKYGMLHRALGRTLAFTSSLGTVSEFSRGELSEILGVSKKRIFVAPNGSDHLTNTDMDISILDRLKLVSNRFFLFVGSPTRNKNLELAIEAFKRLDRSDVKLVVVGSLDNTVFTGGSNLRQEGVVLPGYLTDAEIGALYNQAAALVFPSFYEGFGIPPLEAMAKSCPVLASDIPPVKEVCGDAAEYFMPTDVERLKFLMLARLDNAADRQSIVLKGRERIEQWTWEKSAMRLGDAILGQLRR